MKLLEAIISSRPFTAGAQATNNLLPVLSILDWPFCFCPMSSLLPSFLRPRAPWPLSPFPSLPLSLSPPFPLGLHLSTCFVVLLEDFRKALPIRLHLLRWISNSAGNWFICCFQRSTFPLFLANVFSVFFLSSCS